MRMRKIGKYGNTWVIKLTPSDAKDFDLKEDDEVDIEEIIPKRNKKKNG